MGGILQPDNFYKIKKDEGNIKDRELVRLAAFLKNISQLRDVRTVNVHRHKFEQMEIPVKGKENEIKKTRNKMRQYHHKKKNSELESLKEENMSEST